MKAARFLVLVSTLALGAGLATTAVGAGQKTVSRIAAGKAAPAASGHAQLGDFGIDTAGMNKSVNPGDSFFDYVSGTWVKTTKIPADKSGYGSFNVLADLSRERTKGILDAAAADQGSKIGIAYATYLDQATIDERGLAPIQPWLTRIKGMTDKAGYPALLGEASRNGVRGPWGAGVEQDEKKPDVYTVGLYQGGLGLPDRDYYLKPQFAAKKTAYQAHLARMFTLAGEANAAARAQAVVDYETKIANAHWTRVDSRDATKTYNKMTLAQLAQAAPGFDFAAYFRASGIPTDTVVVAQPSAITGIAALVAATPVQVLQDQLMLRSLDGFADVLPSAFDKEHFAFFGTTLSGTPEQEDRWKRSVDFTSDALSDDVSKLYVAKYFPPETKAAADQLVKNIIAAMNERIDKLTWMTAETKVKAHAKLAAFTPKIGYPSQWHDYSALTITKGDAFGNKLRANQWQSDWEAHKLGQPILRWEWGMTPMEVNAYANPVMVEIVFPAAILQPPFFDPHADPAVNYGAIGAVIGHEMSHHFDDQGAKFNAKGELADWWTKQDVANFDALEGKLATEYDAYEPFPGLHVNGKLTLGENSADLAGLSAAYDAYHASLGGRPAPAIDGYSADQRFYMGWAQVWREVLREEDAKQRLVTDPHSPPAQRADIVRNMDPWYAAFHVQPGSKLYLTPEQRVRIW